MHSLQIHPELLPLVEEIEAQTHNKRSEAFDLCVQVLQRARELHDDLAFIRVAQSYAYLIDQQGYPDAGMALLHEGLQMAQSHHLHQREAQLLYSIGRAYYTRAEYRQAMQCWASCLERARQAGDDVIWSWGKIGIGQIYDALGDVATAIAMHRQAIEQVERLGNPDLLLNVYLNLAYNLYRQGELAEAQADYARVLQLARELGHADDEGETLFRMAEVSLAQGNYELAEEQLAQAYTLNEQSCHWWGLANTLLTQGLLAAARGQKDAALALGQQAQQVSVRAGAAHTEARVWRFLVDAASSAGDVELALHAAHEAHRLETQMAHDSSSNSVLRELEELSGLRASPARQMLELAANPALEQGDEAAVLAQLLPAACGIFGVAACSVWLPESGGKLRCRWRSSQGAPVRATQGELDLAAYPQLAERLTGNELLLAGCVRYHFLLWPLYEELFAPQKIEALLGLPLLLDGQLVACVLFEQDSQPQQWTLEQQLLASQFGEIARRALAGCQRRRALQDTEWLNEALRHANEVLEDRVRQRTSELRASNDELRMAMARLVESEKIAALGNLVAGLAHEMNTPLGVNLISASTLSEQMQSLLKEADAGTLKKSSLREYVGMACESAQLIERNARRASEMMANFKQVAVDTSSNLRRRFDVRVTTQEVLSALYPQYKQRPVKVQLHMPAGIELDSYPGSFEQVLTNFVTNSMLHGFSPEQEGVITISARALDDGNCELDYTDDGKGIPPALFKRVFEPFFTTRFGDGGSGLGLYLVYSLVHGSLGGRLELLPAKRGVHFRLWLPAVAPEPAIEDERNPREERFGE